MCVHLYFLKDIIEENELKNPDSFYHSKMILVHILVYLVDHFPWICTRKPIKYLYTDLISPLQKIQINYHLIAVCEVLFLFPLDEILHS